MIRLPYRVAWWLLFSLLLAAIALGHEGRRIVQLTALALPGLLMLLWPLPRLAARRIRLVLTSLWVFAFILDGVVRGYLVSSYQAAPDSSMVTTALANTTFREMVEYLTMYAWPIAGGITGAVVTGVFAIFLVSSLSQHLSSENRSRGLTAVLILAWLFSAVAYINKPTRSDHPFIFWPKLAESVTSLRLSWQDLEASRTLALQRAKAVAPATASSAPSTIVLVITDSVNRDNLSTHGYARATAPQLQALVTQLNGELVNVRHAWSLAAATLPAFDQMFNFDVNSATAGANKIHMLALARAAGYQVFWISNHDDVGVQQTHALFANELQLLNHVPGRSTTTSDDLALEPFKAALADSHRRKLIIVHLLGVHPHYRLRFPDDENVFAGIDDAVVQEMQRQGRSRWVIESRNEYDAGLRHHDALIAKTLNLTRQSISNVGNGGQGARGAWIYLSDHGQEVGHVSNHAGHSKSTESGYRIPLFIWNSHGIADPERVFDSRPFRADWLGWTVTGLMGLEWPRRTAEHDVLSATYRFEPPKLDIPVESFAR